MARDEMTTTDVKRIVNETIKILNASKEEEANVAAELYFLTYYIMALVDKSLDTKKLKNLSKDDKYETLRQSYETCKYNLQEAISYGFQTAMQKFSGKTDVEYYCSIKTVPSPISKEEH